MIRDFVGLKVLYGPFIQELQIDTIPGFLRLRCSRSLLVQLLNCNVRDSFSAKGGFIKYAALPFSDRQNFHKLLSCNWIHQSIIVRAHSI